MDLLDMEYVSAVGNIKNFCADQQQYNSEFLSYCWLRLLLIVKEYISPQSALELKAVLSFQIPLSDNDTIGITHKRHPHRRRMCLCAAPLINSVHREKTLYKKAFLFIHQLTVSTVGPIICRFERNIVLQCRNMKMFQSNYICSHESWYHWYVGQISLTAKIMMKARDYRKIKCEGLKWQKFECSTWTGWISGSFWHLALECGIKHLLSLHIWQNWELGISDFFHFELRNQ